MEADGTNQALILAHTADCRAEYSRASDAVQLRFGQADLRLTPAQFLSVCATMLKAARALGEQRHIPGLAPPLAPSRRHADAPVPLGVKVKRCGGRGAP